MGHHSRQRRKGTLPHRVRLTQQTTDLIDAYQEQHQVPSFSAAIETLVRLGLEHSPAEIIAPIIVSTIRQELKRENERLIKLIIYDIVETGVAQRLAGAAVRDVGRLKHDDPDRYFKIKAAAIKETRQRLASGSIGQALREVLSDEPPPQPPA